MQASPAEYKRYKRISGAKDIIKKLTQPSKNMQNAKKILTKHPGILGHNEKTKPKDNGYRRDQRLPT